MISNTQAGATPRRRTKPKRRASPLCTYADFAPVLPVEIPRRRVLQLSNAGRFPKYARLGGPRSEPAFRSDAVLAWLRQTYGDLLPDLVASIEEKGFPVNPSFRGEV